MIHLLFIVAIALTLIGIVGCFLPVIPGPPIAWAGMWTFYMSEEHPFRTKELVIVAVIVTLVTAADYVFPSWITKKLGGSKMGVTGSVVGLIVGLFFGPIGIILGPIIGAFLFELIFQKDNKKALKSAFGAFLGFLFGTFSKLIICLIILGMIVYEYVGYFV